MKAFHNDPEIKQKYIDRVKAHQAADEIIKGTYWQEGKGCAVGCTIEGDDHFKYETELGIPSILAYLEDSLFENMSNEDAKKFPLMFLEAIPVGADLSKVFNNLVIWEWEDPVHGMKNIPEISADKDLFDCCENVVTLYKRSLSGDQPSADEWRALEDLAEKIYWASASASAWARARASAWASASASDYQQEIFITAQKLIELLNQAPVE